MFKESKFFIIWATKNTRFFTTDKICQNQSNFPKCHILPINQREQILYKWQNMSESIKLPKMPHFTNKPKRADSLQMTKKMPDSLKLIKNNSLSINVQKCQILYHRSKTPDSLQIAKIFCLFYPKLPILISSGSLMYHKCMLVVNLFLEFKSDALTTLIIHIIKLKVIIFSSITPQLRLQSETLYPPTFI